MDLLNTVRAEILTKNDQIDVKVIGLDVSTINDEKSFGKLLFENLQLSMIAEVIVFHNAGTVGTLTDSVNLSNTKIWKVSVCVFFKKIIVDRSSKLTIS